MKKQLKSRRWHSSQFSPVIRRGPSDPVFNDSKKALLGSARVPRVVLIPFEHSGLPLRPTRCSLSAAQVCASQCDANITRNASSPEPRRIFS